MAGRRPGARRHARRNLRDGGSVWAVCFPSVNNREVRARQSGSAMLSDHREIKRAVFHLHFCNSLPKLISNPDHSPFPRDRQEQARRLNIRCLRSTVNGRRRRPQSIFPAIAERTATAAFELRGSLRAGDLFQLIGGAGDDVFVLDGRLVEKIHRALSVRPIDLHERRIIDGTAHGRDTCHSWWSTVGRPRGICS